MAWNRFRATLAIAVLPLTLAGCEYVRLLRPSALRQLNPRMVRLVNFLPDADDPNSAMVARLFAHGGLSHAALGSDGVFRDDVRVSLNEFIWEPAIIVMEQGGELELKFSNDDQTAHMALMPDVGTRQLLELPARAAGVVRIRLDQPGLYWFGCPVSNHAGRGMLGLVVVMGQVPAEARLDRPPLRQPGEEDE